MKRNEILAVIRNLAKSQGFYCSILEAFEIAKKDNPESYEAFMTELEAQNFSDAVDLVIYLES
jgi:hypothetical protein